MGNCFCGGGSSRVDAEDTDSSRTKLSSSSSSHAVKHQDVALKHFEVQRTLGEGGFGKVNAVVKKTAPDKDKWYAMKALVKQVIVAKKMEEEVLRELALLREVGGSHFVCSAYYAFQDASHLYLVLDLYLGGDLRFHLQKAPVGHLSAAQVRFYGASIILALDFLHTRGVLHRDIKPENVLMNSLGHIALTDLGISAKIEGGGSNNTQTLICTQTSGTPGYMAPEIYWESHRHGVPSEAFSLGVLLYEISTGSRPYPHNLWEKLYHHGEEATYYKTAASAAGEHALFKDAVQSSTPVEMQGLIRQLLKAVPEERGVSGSGSGSGGEGGGGLALLKQHPAFAQLDWEALSQKTLAPPFVPKHEANVQTNVNDLFDDDDGAALAAKKQKETISAADQALFATYRYDHRDPPPPPPPPRTPVAAASEATTTTTTATSPRNSFIGRLSLSAKNPLRLSFTGFTGRRSSSNMSASGASASGVTAFLPSSSSSKQLLPIIHDAMEGGGNGDGGSGGGGEGGEETVCGSSPAPSLPCVPVVVSPSKVVPIQVLEPLFVEDSSKRIMSGGEGEDGAGGSGGNGEKGEKEEGSSNGNEGGGGSPPPASPSAG